MKDITYQISFFSEWHCGSGLTKGSDVDALVVTDKNKLPYIPGKTLKGVLKDAAVQIFKIANSDLKNEPFLTEFFGFFDDEPKAASEIHTKGNAFFTNAVLNEELANPIVANEMQSYLFRNVASTAIETNGIAKEHSLRQIQTVIPCRLEATIYGVGEQYIPSLKKCFAWIKRIGLNRHRGLGRCKFEILEKEVQS